MIRPGLPLFSMRCLASEPAARPKYSPNWRLCREARWVDLLFGR